MSAFLNGSRVVSVRLVLPYRGVWYADVDADPEKVALLPSAGPASLVIGTPPGPVSTLLGVFDPLASGGFVSTKRVRVVGGKGGWSRDVSSQHFHLDAGLLSTVVYNAVAAQVLEQVVDVVPQAFGTDYVLSAGPASRVFGDALWWVDPTTGLTTVAPTRPPAPPSLDLEIMSWDPLRQVADVRSDALVLPGTVLVDLRIPESPVFVRDVEQVFDSEGSRATCICSKNPVSVLQSSLRRVIREFANTGYLPVRRYRVVNPGIKPNTWILQAVDRNVIGQAAPMPDAIPFTAWTGHAGATSKLLPGTEVLVCFVDGDPKQPVIVGYSTLALPLETTIDASVAAHVAPTAPVVDIGHAAASITLGPAPLPLARAAAVQTFLAAVAAFAAACNSSTDAVLVSAASTLAGALSSLGATIPTAVVKGT